MLASAAVLGFLNPVERRKPMTTDLLTSTSSKYDEFLARLKSDVPLIEVVNWWDSTCSHDVSDDTLQQMWEADGAAFGLTLCRDWESSYGAPPVTDESSNEYHLQECWETLKRVRTALQARS
jgi:hypothetical protein